MVGLRLKRTSGKFKFHSEVSLLTRRKEHHGFVITTHKHRSSSNHERHVLVVSFFQ